MFEMTMADSDLLKNSISIIAEIIDEGAFKVKKDSITFIASDRAMVAVVDFKLLSTAFEEYKVTADATIGINMLNLVSVLRRAGSGDKITLRYKEENNRLEIILKGASVRRFEVPLLDISETEIPPIDQLDFTAKIDLKSHVLEQGVSDAEVVSDSIVFDIAPNMLLMKSEGDSSISELKLERGNPALVALDAKENSKSRYPLDYLKKMVKAAKLSDTASIQLGKDYPMRLDFKTVDKLKLGFVLAPRVSDES